MPNHIHLIGEPVHPKKLPKFMQCLHRSYTAYFNNKYNKVGHLWQGRFKTKIIAKDKYLIQCIAYVEQNPVRANLINSPRSMNSAAILKEIWGIIYIINYWINFRSEQPTVPFRSETVSD